MNVAAEKGKDIGAINRLKKPKLRKLDLQWIKRVVNFVKKNTGANKLFDAACLTRGRGEGSPSVRYELKHPLHIFEKRMGTEPWYDVKKGVPPGMTKILEDEYISNRVVPSFERFGKRIAKEYNSFKHQYLGSKEEDKEFIKALMFRRGTVTLNSKLKEFGVIVAISDIAEKLGLSRSIEILNNHHIDIHRGIDILVRDIKTKDEIMRVHVRAGANSKNFSNKRRLERGYKMKKIDVEVSFIDFPDNRTVVLDPTSETIREFRKKLCDYYL